MESNLDLISRTLRQVYSTEWDTDPKLSVSNIQKFNTVNAELKNDNELVKQVVNKSNKKQQEEEGKTSNAAYSWNVEEDARLLAGAIIYGKNFVILKQLLPYRSLYSIKSRWKRTVGSKYTAFTELKVTDPEKYQTIVNYSLNMLSIGIEQRQKLIEWISTKEEIEESKEDCCKPSKNNKTVSSLNKNLDPDNKIQENLWNEQEVVQEEKDQTFDDNSEDKKSNEGDRNKQNSERIEKWNSNETIEKWNSNEMPENEDLKDCNPKDLKERINEKKRKVKDLRWNILYLEESLTKLKSELYNVEQNLKNDEDLKLKQKKPKKSYKRQKVIDDYDNSTSCMSTRSKQIEPLPDEVPQNSKPKKNKKQATPEIIEILDDSSSDTQNHSQNWPPQSQSNTTPSNIQQNIQLPNIKPNNWPSNLWLNVLPPSPQPINWLPNPHSSLQLSLPWNKLFYSEEKLNGLEVNGESEANYAKAMEILSSNEILKNVFPPVLS